MRTIAIEEHFASQALGSDIHTKIDRSASNWATDSADANPTRDLFELGDPRIRNMDANGIDLQVLSHIYFDIAQATPELVRSSNDELAKAVSSRPTRYSAFASLPMMNPEAAADELERAAKTHGFKGALVNGNVEGKFLDDPSFTPVFERAVELDVPIYLHPGFPPKAVYDAYYRGLDPKMSFTLSTTGWGWHSEVGLHSLRLIVSGLFERLPNLQMIIGHMGEMLPFMFTRFDNELPPEQTGLQEKVTTYLQRNFHITTSGLFSDSSLQAAIQTFGVDRIIFSVDYPLASNPHARAFFDGATMSDADRAKISFENVTKLLKL